MLDSKDPFGYSLLTYAWVVGLACVAGVVKYLNSKESFSWRNATRDVITSAFTGVVAFWTAEYYSVNGPLQAVAIAISAVMGNRAWVEFENIIRMRFGLPNKNADSDSNSNAGAPQGEQQP